MTRGKYQYYFQNMTDDSYLTNEKYNMTHQQFEGSNHGNNRSRMRLYHYVICSTINHDDKASKHLQAHSAR